MLQELANIRQPEEPRRRWFADDYFDLIVWFDPRGEITGFQLCYDIPGDEHALTWHEKTGFSHLRVDDGDSQRPFKASPILVADGWCDAFAVAQLFKTHSSAMDEQVARFVLAKIGEYHSKANTV